MRSSETVLTPRKDSTRTKLELSQTCELPGLLGDIYRCVDESLGQIKSVEVIFLPQSIPGSVRSKLSSLLANDLKTRTLVSHPNLLRIDEVSSDGDLSAIYVTSELVFGDTLGSLVEVIF